MSSGWLTNLVVMKVGLIVEHCPMVAEMAGKTADWRADWRVAMSLMEVMMAIHCWTVAEMAGKMADWRAD